MGIVPSLLLPRLPIGRLESQVFPLEALADFLALDIFAA